MDESTIQDLQKLANNPSMTVLRFLTHRATAYFQAVLSIVFILGYFFVLFQFLFGRVKVPGEFHDMMQTLLGILTGALGTVIQFWFSRQRTSSDSGEVAKP